MKVAGKSSFVCTAGDRNPHADGHMNESVLGRLVPPSYLHYHHIKFSC
jgi:hypothetical protein